MFDNIDLFVALSEGNTSVTILDVYPFDSAPGNYECWDKVGQIVGNLIGLTMIVIFTFNPILTTTTTKTTGMCLTGRHSVTACGVFGKRLGFVRLQMTTMQRLKKSKALPERFTAIL